MSAARSGKLIAPRRLVFCVNPMNINGMLNLAKRADLFELIGAKMQSTNTIEGVHTTRREIADALESAAGTVVCMCRGG